MKTYIASTYLNKAGPSNANYQCGVTIYILDDSEHVYRNHTNLSATEDRHHFEVFALF